MKRRVTKRKVKKRTGKAAEKKKGTRSHDKERQHNWRFGTSILEDGFPATLNHDLVWCSDSSVEPKTDGWNTKHASNFLRSQFGISILNHHHMVGKYGEHDLHLEIPQEAQRDIAQAEDAGSLGWVCATSWDHSLKKFQVLTRYFWIPQKFPAYFSRCLGVLGFRVFSKKIWPWIFLTEDAWVLNFSCMTPMILWLYERKHLNFRAHNLCWVGAPTQVPYKLTVEVIPFDKISY